jgi:hypothetical protein
MDEARIEPFGAMAAIAADLTLLIAALAEATPRLIGGR